ncbi:outer membrane protein [Ketogulonicigenium vulgare]|uniref:Outer membrane protein n=1 Tax=Ketogulonicigenium vulgare (strain WSH-001) TaxID=759362 RepID=F9Y7A0_KETVW|nr:outer membrane beta-barrel protein [Ketogulonicigenium vulgare]ADO42842.1 outer membrane protein [Ketogulonicigenium vulgare Y25]AEM41028.1 Outer membrane protein [Ketogulonicigenium vulgare WSH-001]ALJ81178.1 hypothetical protein KVH_08300 [Ketogulonicigenium vulgare]ANW33922.1 hypothetical protein KvSKV_08270 [Ketogulonicigenium vulgare]AOZ54755.1 outer membrane protein [Ketogulonicigenium vulgare]
MKNLIVATTALVASATFAQAGGLAAPTIEAPVAAPVVIAAPAPVTTWAGAYAGAALTYGETEGSVGGTSESIDGVGVALRGGYDWQFGSWVLGLGAEYAYNNEDGDVFGATAERKDSAAVFARAGYALDTWLPYVSAGYTWSDAEVAGTSYDLEGATYGVGVEKLFTQNISGFAEYSFADFDDVQGVSVEGQGVKLGVNYRF